MTQESTFAKKFPIHQQTVGRNVNEFGDTVPNRTGKRCFPKMIHDRFSGNDQCSARFSHAKGQVHVLHVAAQHRVKEESFDRFECRLVQAHAVAGHEIDRKRIGMHFGLLVYGKSESG